MELYKELASLIQAIRNCENSDNKEWRLKHQTRLRELVKERMPRGSGFDNGTQIDISESHPDKLVFVTGYHHMNAGGYYDGRTEHKVIVTPSLSSGFDLRITGRNRNDIKDHIQ